MVPRHSGLQKDVLSLYRKLLREAFKKDQAAAPSALPFTARLGQLDSSTSYAAAEFRRQASSVQRSDFKKIEYMLRKGEKQLKLLRMPGVSTVRGAH